MLWEEEAERARSQSVSNRCRWNKWGAGRAAAALVDVGQLPVLKVLQIVFAPLGEAAQGRTHAAESRIALEDIAASGDARILVGSQLFD